MKGIYQLSLILYKAAISLVSPFNKKAKQWSQGRKNWEGKYASDVACMGDNIQWYWFHCASLGEFEQARPIIEQIRLTKRDNERILVSFFSPSGYEVKKNDAIIDYSCYLPLDSKRNAEEFLSIFKVKNAFFVKYEIWYFYLRQLSLLNIDSYLVSATFRENHYLFGFKGKWMLPILNTFKCIFLQDQKSLDLLIQHGINNGVVAGDTRFDRVFEHANNVKDIPFIKEFKNKDRLVVLGSSWEEEEKLLQHFVELEGITFKCVIAPHDISEAHIISIKKKFPKAVLYSQLTLVMLNEGVDIIIIDSIGILSSLYQYGEVAIVGGGMKNALHNILEPATFGLTLMYGSNCSKYWEGKALVDAQGAFFFSSQDDFNKRLKLLLTDEELLSKTGMNAKDFIKNNTGATQKIIGYL